MNRSGYLSVCGVIAASLALFMVGCGGGGGSSSGVSPSPSPSATADNVGKATNLRYTEYTPEPKIGYHSDDAGDDLGQLFSFGLAGTNFNPSLHYIARVNSLDGSIVGGATKLTVNPDYIVADSIFISQRLLPVKGGPDVKVRVVIYANGVIVPTTGDGSQMIVTLHPPAD